MIYTLASIAHFFVLTIGYITIIRWCAKSWRTRKDNRHDINTRGTGAF